MKQPESPERWQQIKQVYYNALDLPAEQHAAFLAQACAGDTELLAEVTSLLSSREAVGDFIAQPALHLAARQLAHEENSTVPQYLSTQPAPELALGATLDQRYLIEQVLGHGGIGVVYLARDQKLHQTPVVIKVLREKLTESQQSQWITKKFQQEIKALARIDHPSVVRVLDTGTLLDGRAYLVMQYDAGNSLRAVLAAEGMELERVGTLLRQLGQGLGN